jgi:RimJ/RimL family protein N-acetyltransferase
MKIRKANNSDKKEVFDFCKNTFEWGDYIDRVWDSWISDSSGLLLVSEEYNNDNSKIQPIAIAHISFCPYNSLWIEGVRVDKNYRKQGVATSLLKYMLNFGIKKGVKEANALVSLSNTASQKMLEKQGFFPLFVFKYYNVTLGKKKEIDYSPLTQKLKLKIPHPGDISSIIDYLCGSKVSEYLHNRYFNSWKLYKFENTYSGLFSMISNNEILMIVDEINKINGILIINIIKNTDSLSENPLIQICYFDCIDYYRYIEIINLLRDTYCNKSQYCNIQFFLPDCVDLRSHFEKESTNYFEHFLYYSKKLINN